MPTPSGLPKKGDRLKHKEGVTFVVIKREGSGIVYSIVARREDGQLANGNHAPGYPKDHIRIHEFPWHLQRGLFMFLTEESS